MRLMLGVAALAANVIAVPAAITLDQSLPAYQAVTGISGQIKSVGSDTLGHEITLWAKAFKGLYPDVKIEIEAFGLGYGTAGASRRRISIRSNVAPNDGRRGRGV